MQKLIRTSITIPEELYRLVRIYAARENESVSKLITRSLSLHIKGNIKPKKKKDPLSVIGSLRLGGKEPYKHRSEIYEEHLKRKMGY